MFDLQGHRGARGLWPENTLAGFTRAIELGVSGIELDCGVTRDGVVVVTHDPELNPELTRDAQGNYLPRTGPPVCALSYDELRHYDVGRVRPGSDYAARFPEQQPIDGEHIPRLREVLALVRGRGRGRVRVSIEIKTFADEPARTLAPGPFVAAVGRDIEHSRAANTVAILCFDWRVLRETQQRLPHIATVALTEQQPAQDTVRIGAAHASPWLAGFDPADFGNCVTRLVQATGAGTWGPDYLDLNAERVEQAHALGLRVVPWTVNERADMVRMLEYNVDGMISDRPDQLRMLLQERGMEVPPGSGAQGQ
jgi:glycerophosphoryl diester phosphodiesterase